MNNLLVQQKGLSATGQDAVGIANMIGKALQGNVTALTKVGITMSDAEKNAIKFGTETERAAAISRIITNNVGEMNAEMAKTDAGKAQHLALYGLRTAAGPNMLAVTAATALYGIIRILSSSAEEATGKTRGLANATEMLKSAEEAGMPKAKNNEEQIMQDSWERMRMNATIAIQPHIKGKMTPEKLLPFPWEKSKKKAEAPKVSAEEARKRFERLVGK